MRRTSACSHLWHLTSGSTEKGSSICTAICHRDASDGLSAAERSRGRARERERGRDI